LGADRAYHFDAVDLTFDAQTEMGHRKGYAFALTRLFVIPGSGGDGHWNVDHLAGYLAEPGLEPIAAFVLERMVSDLRVNPQWASMMSRVRESNDPPSAQ
jgi:hypothetical protein